jgi:S-adenosyl-L-methionine hydrolase (adenosine-forming)
MMTPTRIVTLTTDFGTKDPFAAQMKGAALSIHRDLTFVDITHEVPPHDVEAGAYLLWTAYALFPPGTIHVAVIDPGVGTSRRAVAVRTDRYIFLAPDNGLLSRVLEEGPPGSAYELVESHYRRTSVSATFEGRDVFAPAAGYIARGVELSNLGPPAGDLVRLERQVPDFQPGRPCAVRVLVVDRFGNATLDIPRRVLDPWPEASGPPRRLRIHAPGGDVSRLVRTYADAEPGQPVALVNSAEHLEIAVREGRAAERLGLAPGVEVQVTLES